VLAALAVHVNEVVPVGALVDELWGERVPRSALTTMQTYILQLRSLIDRALRIAPDGALGGVKHILATHPRGYALYADEEAVDLRQFERLALAGHHARRLGDFETASRCFTGALRWWRGGQPLVDVHLGSLLRVEVYRLEESRLNVLDRRIDADLRLGRHHELLGELAGLVGTYRTHEGMYAHLMLALYRSGRRGEATLVYRRLHKCLADELGLEPSPVLRRLQRAILEGDPHLLDPRGTGSSTDAHSVGSDAS
jgi:DNA-binding SARP family transcriptional activator